MSTTVFPLAVDTFPDIDAAGGDMLNSAGKLHDAQHDKKASAVAALERVHVGPTHYNERGYPQATFDQRLAAALADCHVTGGVVVIPPISTASAGMGTIAKPIVSIEGPGKSGSVIITYTGTGDLLRWQDSPAAIQQHGTIRGLTLLGNLNPNAVGIRMIDCATVPGLEDLVISGFKGTNGRGISMENVSFWCERATGDRVHLNDNKIGLRMWAPPVWTSFGYHTWLNLYLNIATDQIGIQSAGNALVYNGIWNIMANGGGGTSLMIDVADSSVWATAVINARGEALGNGARVASGASFNPSGNWNPGAPDIGVINAGGLNNSLGTTITNIILNPSVAMGAASGAGGPGAVPVGNSSCGIITFGTGTTPTPGGMMVVTYERPYVNNPAGWVTPVTISSINSNTAALRPYCLPSNTGFIMGFEGTPAASQPINTYGFSYTVG